MMIVQPSCGLPFSGIQIGAEVVAGDAGQALNFKNALGGDGPPLTDSTRRYTQRDCKVTAASSCGV